MINFESCNEHYAASLSLFLCVHTQNMSSTRFIWLGWGRRERATIANRFNINEKKYPTTKRAAAISQLNLAWHPHTFTVTPNSLEAISCFEILKNLILLCVRVVWWWGRGESSHRTHQMLSLIIICCWSSIVHSRSWCIIENHGHIRTMMNVIALLIYFLFHISGEMFPYWNFTSRRTSSLRLIKKT